MEFLVVDKLGFHGVKFVDKFFLSYVNTQQTEEDNLRSQFIRLHNTLIRGDLDELMTFIGDSGYNFNAKYGGKPLYFYIFERLFLAARYVPFFKIVPLADVFDFSLTDEDGHSLLHYAVEADRDALRIVVWLLRFNLCDVNAVSHAKRTPLHLAVNGDYRLGMLVALVGGGASIFAKDDDGISPIEGIRDALVIFSAYLQFSGDFQKAKDKLIQFIRDFDKICHHDVPSSTSDVQSDCSSTSDVQSDCGPLGNDMENAISDDFTYDNLVREIFDSSYRKPVTTRKTKFYQPVTNISLAHKVLVYEWLFFEQTESKKQQDILSLHLEADLSPESMHDVLHKMKYYRKAIVRALPNKYFSSSMDIVHDLTGIANCTPELDKEMSVLHRFMDPIQKSYLYVCLFTGKFEVMFELLKLRSFDIIPMCLVIVICLNKMKHKFVLSKTLDEEIDRTIQKCEKACCEVVTSILRIHDTGCHDTAYEFMTLPIAAYGNNSIYDLAIKARCADLVDLEVLESVKNIQWLGSLRTMSTTRRLFLIMCPYSVWNSKLYTHLFGDDSPLNKCSFNDIISYPVSKYVYHVLAHVVFLLVMTYLLVTTFNDGKYVIVDVLTFSYVFGHARDEIVECKKRKWDYFKDAWNIVDWGGILCFIIGFIIRMVAIHSQGQDNMLYTARVFSVISLLFYFLRTLYYFQIMPSIGPKITMVARMAKNDMLPLLSIFFVVLLSFGIAAQVLLYPYTPNTDKNVASFLTTILKVLVKSFYTMITADYLLGDFDIELCDNRTMCPDKRGILFVKNGTLIIYIIIANILLLNLLIAVFTKSVSEVETQSRKYCIIRRHYILGQMRQKGLPPPFNFLSLLKYPFPSLSRLFEPNIPVPNFKCVSSLVEASKFVMDLQAELFPNKARPQRLNEEDWRRCLRIADQFCFLHRQTSFLRNMRGRLFT